MPPALKLDGFTGLAAEAAVGLRTVFDACRFVIQTFDFRIKKDETLAGAALLPDCAESLPPQADKPWPQQRLPAWWQGRGCVSS
jgi:hypothetical protein